MFELLLYCTSLACVHSPCPNIEYPPVDQQIREFMAGEFKPVWYGGDACRDLILYNSPGISQGLAAYAN